MWAHAQPSAALLAAYEADPAAVLRTDFTATLREVLEVLAAPAGPVLAAVKAVALPGRVC